MRIQLLGTGTSTGVPVIGCTCPVCTSDDPRDRRLRTACHIEIDGIHLLIDVGPDFRTQALRYPLRAVDGVLITHHHFDHVVGLDDLRPFLFRTRSAIPCFAMPNSANVLRNMFSYIFRDGSYPGVPRLTMHDVAGPFKVASRADPKETVLVTPIPAVHGSLDVLGYRVGKFAYLTDVSDIPFASRGLLEDLDVLVLDALRDEPHPMHMTIDRAIEVAGGIGARQTVFTHMAHNVLHSELERRMPSGMHPGHDGMILESR